MSVGEGERDLPLIRLAGEIKSPPFSDKARAEAGAALRVVQQGGSIGMPRSRPMPSIGPRCHELRVADGNRSWRIFYHVDPGTAVLLLGVLAKKTQKTPKQAIEACRALLAEYHRTDREDG